MTHPEKKHPEAIHNTLQLLSYPIHTISVQTYTVDTNLLNKGGGQPTRSGLPAYFLGLELSVHHEILCYETFTEASHMNGFSRTTYVTFGCSGSCLEFSLTATNNGPRKIKLSVKTDTFLQLSDEDIEGTSKTVEGIKA
jgi:hypothetical protein